MEILLILVIFILLLSLSYFFMNFYKYTEHNPFKLEVPKQTAYSINRLGKNRIILEGFQNYLPFIDEIEAVISLKEELFQTDKLEIFTLDNEKINLDYKVFYQVIEPRKALKNVYNYKSTLRSLILISTLNVISNTRLANIKTNTIQKIKEDIEKESLNWGIQIPRIVFDKVSI